MTAARVGVDDALLPDFPLGGSGSVLVADRLGNCSGAFLGRAAGYPDDSGEGTSVAEPVTRRASSHGSWGSPDNPLGGRGSGGGHASRNEEGPRDCSDDLPILSAW